MKKWIVDRINFIKALLTLGLALLAFFVDKDNFLQNKRWLLIAILIFISLFFEYFDYKNKNMKPIDRAKEYLLDFKNWQKSNGSDYRDYYEPSPEFAIKNSSGDSGLYYNQEWARGEIGYHYSQGNDAYYREIYFNDISVAQIHIVIFDGGKKTIVAPDWSPIGMGRIYYYLKDSIEYKFQQFQSHQLNSDHSKQLSMQGSRGYFNIPIFKNKNELEKFIDFCNVKKCDHPEYSEEKQTELFYENLQKYDEFKEFKFPLNRLKNRWYLHQNDIEKV